MELRNFFENNPRVALGFSGGADSSFLLFAALQAGAEVGVYFVKTPFQPQFELEDAKQLAEKLGADLKVIEFDVLTLENVRNNPKNRCYYCKKAIFGLISERAEADGFPMLIDGTNASDEVDDRPGMRALCELAVRSPLRECGITKVHLRELSRDAGLFTWNKPAYACLATRIQVDEEITLQKLEKVEWGEAALVNLGFSDLRLRLCGEGARLELPESQHAAAKEKWNDVLENLTDFETIELAKR